MSFIELRNRKIKRKSKSIVNLNSLFSIVADDKESSDSDSGSDKRESRLDESVIFVNESLVVDVSDSIDKKIENCKVESKNIKTIMPFDSKVALKIIPSMKDKDDLHRFCRCVDIVWKPLVEKNDKKFCLDIIISKLEKSAYDVVRYRDFENWPDLKKALENKFVKRRSQGIVSTELISLVQTNDVSSFSDKIEALLGELNEICIFNQGVDNVDVIMELNERTALSSFVNGLNEPLSTIVKARNFESLSDAIQQAIEEEISQKSKINKQNFKLKCSFCNKSNHKSQNCFKNPSNGQNQNRNKNRFNFQSKSDKNSNSNFPQNSNNNAPSSNVQNKNLESNQTLFCNYCKGNDHIINNCFKKKYNELKRTFTSTETQSQLKNPDCHHVKFNENKLQSENCQGTQHFPSTSVRVQDLSAQTDQK